MGMTIGCCLPSDFFIPQKEADMSESINNLLTGYQTIKAAGYDFMETPADMVMKLSEAEFTWLAAQKEKGEFEIQSCNSFLPGKFRVANPSDLPRLTNYAEEAIHRMSLLGVKIVVFGNGAVRRLPEQNVTAEIRAIEDFLRMCNEKGGKYGVIVVLEPLNKKETNVFNTVSEGASLVRKLNLQNVRLLADSYHTFCENEPLLALEENGDILRHIHVAEAPDRTYPGKNGGMYLCDFAKHLRGANYNGRVSIECTFVDFIKEIRLSYPQMRKLFR